MKRKTRVRTHPRRINGKRVIVEHHTRQTALAKIKRLDKRSRRAIAQDKRINASIVLSKTPKNIERWKKNKSRIDLIGWDALVGKVRQKQAVYKDSPQYQIKKSSIGYTTLRKTTGLTGIEEHHLIETVSKYVDDPQKIDIESLIDSDLSYDENRELIEAALNPTMAQAYGNYY
jgi:hypothetical protein